MPTLAPPKRRPILTDLDKELLARLLQQSQTPIEAYTRESALGVPWGSLANSLVGGMLAGRERRRQEEKIKRSDAYADKVSEIMNMGTDLVPGQVSISPEGTFVRGDAFKASTEAPLGVPYAPIGPSTYGDTLGNYASSGIAEEQLFEQGIPVEDQLAAQFARDNPDKVLPGDHIVPTNVEGGGVSSWLRDRPATLTVGEEFPEDSSMLTRFLSGKEEPVTLNPNANVALSQALRGAGYEPLEYMQYMQNQKLLNAKKPPEYKTMGGELTLYNKNTNQEIRAQRYLVVNSDGTTSNVLMNIQTGELEQDPNQFTFEKPEEGSFIYSKSLTPLTIVTDGGGILARGFSEFDNNGVPTGYASVDGQRVKVSTLDYDKGKTITDALAIPNFETSQRKDYTNASIYKTYGDVKVQIGKLNAIREAQDKYKNDRDGFIEFVREDLGLGKEQIKSFNEVVKKEDTLTSDGIFDWASIFLFNKLLDEGSVVRDPEVKQTIDTSGIEGRVKTLFASLAEGDKIPDEVRQSISIAANTIRNEVEKQYLNNAKTTANTIKNWKESNPLLEDLNYANIISDWNNIKKEIDPEGFLYNNGNAW